MPQPKKIPAFTPYFTEEQADQVRAAFLETGEVEGDASVSDFIVYATMREVKRRQRKYNGGKPWPPVNVGGVRRGQRRREELRHRREEV